jgi:phosphatidate cytidylyltransferase
MAPSISPGKTWEGAAAGVIGSVIVSFLFTLDTPFRLPLNLVHSLVLGVLISIFGQLGDLAESILKRGAGIKDSGTLMPGHGGLLDRLDSILFAGVVVYLFYSFWIM